MVTIPNGAIATFLDAISSPKTSGINSVSLGESLQIVINSVSWLKVARRRRFHLPGLVRFARHHKH